MRSSRTRTIRCSGRLRGVSAWGMSIQEVSAQGVFAWRGVFAQGGVYQGGCLPGSLPDGLWPQPIPCEQNHREV